jgi:hypothetical protein
MTSGEKRVSERLERKLEDDYLLWYDVPIGLKYSKPDFVIFHRRRGPLVLEGKYSKIETIKVLDRTSFTLITDGGIVQASNPVAQARMYTLEASVVLERTRSFAMHLSLSTQGSYCHLGPMGLP